ncbi:hypothetical protein [Streptomyces sp. NPDC015125]|uniref:hypothetical protein n=1 Tax=Streptomyces sp. NPDC015125 TaxID=3364938 RepID=UPI0036FAC315
MELLADRREDGPFGVREGVDLPKAAVQVIPCFQESCRRMSSGCIIRTGQGDQRTRDGEQAQDIAALHIVIITVEKEGKGRGHGSFGRLFFEEKPFQLREGDS